MNGSLGLHWQSLAFLLVLLQLGIMMNTHSINILGLVLLVGGILLLLFVINLQNFWANHWWQFWK
jgi:hypothetical protein